MLRPHMSMSPIKTSPQANFRYEMETMRNARYAVIPWRTALIPMQMISIPLSIRPPDKAVYMLVRILYLIQLGNLLRAL
jgi:hypothetical protein